ncbi:MAG: hypothetical protein ACXWYJ_02915 [Actinomycetota bacterium]
MTPERRDETGASRRAAIGVRGASRRAIWGLGDQAFSSLTNFALSAVVARSVSPHEFGRFALVFAAYVLALGVVRSLGTLAVLVRFSAVTQERWREAAATATGAAVVLGGATAAVCVVLALIVPGLRYALLALAVSLPGLLLQESWRHVFLARGRPSLAFVNDVIWATALVPALWIPIAAGASTVEPFILAWGAAAGVAALAGLAQARLVPAPSRGSGWIRTHWDLGGRQLGEFVANTGSNQLVMFIAGAVAGLATAGALRAGQVMLGPLTAMLQGVWFVTLPELVRVLRHRPERFHRVAVLLSVALGACSSIYLLLILAFGSRLGPILLGPSWPNARVVVVPLAVANICWGLWIGATTGLRAMQEAARSLRVRLLNAALTVAGGSLGVVLGGTGGAAWGLAAAYVLTVGAWWWQFETARASPRGLTEPGTAGEDADVATELLGEVVD